MKLNYEQLLIFLVLTLIFLLNDISVSISKNKRKRILYNENVLLNVLFFTGIAVTQR